MGLIAYPLASIVDKLVAVNKDVNILAFTCLMMLSSSFILLVIAGPGKLTKESLKTPHTWIYGILETVTVAVGIMIMVYISATEAAALSRTTAFFALAISLMFLNQPTNKIELVGSACLIFGFIFVINGMDIPLETKGLVILLVILKNVLQASKKITAEVHKTNRKSKNFKEELRVVGLVMGVTSVMVSSTFILLALFQNGYNLTLHEEIPTIMDFLNFKTFVLAFFSGVILLSINKYLEFYVSKTLGAKYLMAMASLQLVGVYCLELILSNFGVLEMKQFSQESIFALMVIFVGNSIIALSGFMKDIKFIKKGEVQDTLANVDGNFVEDEEDFNVLKLNLSSLLSLYDHNSKKLSKAIDINRVVLDNIANYEYGEFKIEKKIAKKINDFASTHVSTTDQLTKAHNRYYLDHIVTSLLKNNELFNLYYLDLNNFKPVNDKYGHEVGDYVLSETVAKLNALKDFNNYVFRLGGDEFVLIQIANLEQQFEELIMQTIEQPVEYEAIPLKISTAIGRVHSEKYDNLEDMLKDADSLMYDDKKKS
tara:strand:- start:7157 stop:8779 length:1623 start_codon:yes stop_codon:yes gene_type:complete